MSIVTDGLGGGNIVVDGFGDQQQAVLAVPLSNERQFMVDDNIRMLTADNEICVLLADDNRRTLFMFWD